MLATTACGDGSDSQSQTLPKPIFQTAEEPAGDTCENGGVLILTGVDADEDGELSDEEIETTSAICNGIAGMDGANGPDQSVDGMTTADVRLVDTKVLMEGDPDCPYGGTAIRSGIDANQSGALSNSEVVTIQFVCNGAPAAAALVETVPLAEGDSNCEAGGSAVSHGLDDNGDGVLDPDEVTATEYLCNGVAAGEAACTFPATWNETDERCDASLDWAGSDLQGRSLVGTYLAGVDLSGSDLSDADLTWSVLTGANLSSAQLVGADLSNASVDGANFDNSVFDGADLEGVDLSDASLDGASGSGLVNCPERLPAGWSCWSLGASGNTLVAPGTDLSGLDLSGADLSSTPLAGVQATGLAGCPAALPPNWACIDFPVIGNTLVGPRADLSGLDLSGGDFSPTTNLSNVTFRDAVLTGAAFAASTDLRNADFRNANLTGVTIGDDVNLRDSSFSGANFTDATVGSNVDFRDSNLYGTDFTNVDLSGARLGGTTATNVVTCPDTMPSSWSCISLPDTGNTFVGPDADLSELSFAGADLSNQNLSGANLDGSDLTGANLNGANLNNVDLQGVTLDNVTGMNLQECPDGLPNGWDCVQRTLVGPSANLVGANLNGADLTDAELTNANLSGANLSGSDLDGVNMSAATLTGIRATGLDNCPASLPTGYRCVRRTILGPGVDASNANLSQASLGDTDLTGANLSGADLSDADLQNATLDGADLSGADLSNADLSNADLSNADLSNADLSDADLSNATLTGATLSGVTWNNTTCPSGVNSDDNGNVCP